VTRHHTNPLPTKEAIKARSEAAANIIVKGNLPKTSNTNAARDALKVINDHKMSVDAQSSHRADQLKRAFVTWCYAINCPIWASNVV
jgi:ribosomal protein L13